MKVLLDENLPHLLRSELPGHEVFTVAYMGSSGVENSELLRRAFATGFDVVLTDGRGVDYEERLIVLLTKSNTIEAIRPMCPEILATLARLHSREFVKLSS